LRYLLVSRYLLWEAWEVPPAVAAEVPAAAVAAADQAAVHHLAVHRPILASGL